MTAHRVDRVFCRIMNSSGQANRMRTELVEVSDNVLLGHGAAVAGGAVLFLLRELEQPGFDPGVMRGVTALACVVAHRLKIRVWPWVQSRPIPGFGRNRMAGGIPAIHIVTGNTKG
ncbi:hypothetical protein SDC9_201010 [bioreactor metagenome]|uniref:Uncharacterized protein n=1 Tax=bioreactor metagenome TaxID=1076179 RepID=A0A645IQH5_9ZZZZ